MTAKLGTNSEDPPDYSFVVKRRANPPKPWRWEIYCACKSKPVERSPIFFEAWQKQAKLGKRRSHACWRNEPLGSSRSVTKRASGKHQSGQGVRDF
jgi:hypothetical protein